MSKLKPFMGQNVNRTKRGYSVTSKDFYKILENKSVDLEAIRHLDEVLNDIADEVILYCEANHDIKRDDKIVFSVGTRSTSFSMNIIVVPTLPALQNPFDHNSPKVMNYGRELVNMYLKRTASKVMKGFAARMKKMFGNK